MSDKVLVQYELILQVEDYAGDFEKCAADTNKVHGIFNKLLKEMFPDNDKAWEIGQIHFQEFDSTNPSHAAAYFLCDVMVNVNDLFWAYAMLTEEDMTF